MLKGIALEYYHSNFHGLDLTISQLIQNFQNDFEGHEHRQNMLREENSTNLGSMWHKAPGKPKSQVFNEVVQHLRSIQRGLDREFQTDAAIRNKVISAVSNIPACSSAVLQPVSSLSP